MSSELDITIIPTEGQVVKPYLPYNLPKNVNGAGQKLAIITDFPHTEDLNKSMWFAGESGELFFRQLKLYGLDREHVFIGGLTRSQPDHVGQNCVGGIYKLDNDILRSELDKFNPNLILGVGEKVLRAAVSKSAEKDGKKESAILKWRGSVVSSDLPLFKDYKFMAIHNPRDVFSQWGDLYPLFAIDIKKAVAETYAPELVKKHRNYRINLTVDQLILELEKLCLAEEVSIDIEGYVYALACIGFAPTDDEAFILPWNQLSDNDRVRIFPTLAKFLRSRARKILQNGQYDNFVLTYTYGCFISHIRHDTMVASWELFPELPRKLATQLSLWTDIPYYKDDRESTSIDTRHEYCCTDCCGTKELKDVQTRQLVSQPGSLRHFSFNMALLPGIMYLQLRGIHYWKDKAYSHLCTTRLEMAQLQKDLEAEVNAERGRLLLLAREQQSLDIRQIPPHREFNPSSSKQVMVLLYDDRRYPKQFSRPTKAKPIPTLTSDTPALLELLKTHNGPEHEILHKLLRYRFLETRAEALEWKIDDDGRMRAAYDCCGTVTGRFSCRKSPTGTGANLQTATSKLRHLFRADVDCDFYQCDLSGADMWTVAAWSKALEDSTMFDDLMYGLKPAKLVVLMYKYGDISKLDRATLKKMSKEVQQSGPEGSLYAAAKAVVHGTNYGLGLDTMAMTIMLQTHKKQGRALITKKEDNRKLQGFYKQRYPGCKSWQDHCKKELQKSSRLVMSNGHTRRFFGRKDDHSTFREYLSTEPQAVTTFATNTAFLRLWTDKENRRKLNPLNYEVPISRRRIPFHVEPLHQVHDALNGQWPKVIRKWAIEKVRSWFNNPVTVAGQTFVIPFEGGWGPSWEEIGPDKENRWEGGEI